MKRLAILLIALLAVSCSSRPPAPPRGELAAMLLVTGDFDTFLRDWHELPAAEAPAVPSVQEAYAGDAVTAFVLFRGCKANTSGVCDAEVDYDVVRPDGTPYAPHSVGPLWTAPAPSEGMMQLAQARLTLSFELGDALGEYVIHAKITDRVTGRVITLEQRVKVSAKPGAVAA